MKAKDVAKTAWNLLRAGTLMAADGIIVLSLMRKGRPRPGIRTAWPAGLRESLSREQRGRCVYCRAKLRISHIDHIVPVAQGGTNDKANLQLLCAGCNLRKSDRNDTEFRARYRGLLPQERGRMPERRIAQAQFRSAARGSSDSTSYTRFKAGKYLTPAQKVNSGSIATGIVVGLPIILFAEQAIVAILVGLAAGLGVRVRAWYTGKDQEDE